MSWWNRTKPVEPEIIEARAGEIVPCDDPQNVIIVPPKEPEPDLSSKPKDIVGYCFGYVCPKKHVGETFDNLSVDGFGQRRACQTCGAVAKPATVRRTAEARWANLARPDMNEPKPEPNWGWYNSYVPYFGKSLNCGNRLWTHYKFVHYLDTSKPARRKK